MKQSILAVDDEVHLLIFLERVIKEKTDYNITTTGNSLEVPELLSKHQYDLIITDLKMPGLNGLDILKMVREQNRHEEVVIITAYWSQETAVEALSCGVIDYITKPFKKELILLTVDRVMKWQRLKREAAVMNEIFNSESYSTAASAFRKEYIRRLVSRSHGDAIEIAERSGLPAKEIETTMKLLEG